MENSEIKNVSIQEAKETSDDGVITNSAVSTNKTTSKKKKSGSTVSVGNGVIGSAGAERKTTTKSTPNKKVENDTVAIYSTKNADWRGVGSIAKGYNIVSVAQSEKWLTRNHVRLATPEEVAKEFGA
jgi:hypothetical protein